ncbi:MAG: 30S ribosomal protein S8 [Candidatus Altiarchaeota archaeon]
MRSDLVNDAISTIRNYERIGRQECVIQPVSKLLIDVLHVFQKEGYIGEFEVSENSVGGEIRVKLVGKINDCGAIKPNFPSKHLDFPKWEKRFLPSRDFGILVVSTSKGVVNHKQAKELSEGGRLLAYVY